MNTASLVSLPMTIHEPGAYKSLDASLCCWGNW